MLKQEFVKNEKVFSGTKVQQTQSCAVMVQIFIAAIEYIQQVEELKKQHKWS